MRNRNCTKSPFLINIDGLIILFFRWSIYKNPSFLLAGIADSHIFRNGFMHFFILVIIVPLEFIDFLENLKEDFSRTGLVVLALVDKDFLEFAFYAFYYLLGVVCWHYLVVLAVEEDYRNV